MRRLRTVVIGVACALLAAACAGTTAPRSPAGHPHSPTGRATSTTPASATRLPSGPAPSTDPAPDGLFTIAFAGDVNFAERTAARLAADPATVFAEAAPGLGAADLTMVNLETAITTGGVRQDKAFTFRAPPSAFTALRDAGVDLATMANNHGADYGEQGLADTLAAIKDSGFPVVGIGADQTQAFTPYTTTLHGVKVAILAADQVQDETTLRLFSAGPDKAGVANAFSPLLLDAVRRARAAGYVVIVYVHWGTEYVTCPNADQRTLAAQLAGAGATAIVGTHAHVLQGAGWRSDGAYVAYGLGNYLWWRSFGNDQDDNGVLTLTFRRDRVIAASFAPSRLDDRGVPMPATGAERSRILAEWQSDRSCTGLSAAPPP